MPNDFDKPLDKWVTEKEEHEVPTNSFNPTTGHITTGVERVVKETKVIYEKPRDLVKFCDDLTHVWTVLDRNKYIIKCKNCPLCKHILVGREYIDKEGHIRSVDNDRLIA